MEPAPTVTATRVAPDTDALTAHLPVPGLGVLPVNAFVIHAAEPVLVDAGVVALRDAWFDALAQTIDPADVRWIWLTHTDADHTGCLEAVLAAAPKARVVTTFLGLAKLGLRAPPSPERILLLNPGQTLDVGDRTLACLRPPTYDAPETTALFDRKTRTLFSADSFGALLDAPVARADAVDPVALREGLVTWAGIDAPWLADAKLEPIEQRLEALAALAPETVLGSHLAPAPGMLDALAGHLRAAVGVTPPAAPDQAAFERMLVAS